MSTTTADVTVADLAARLTRLEDVRAIEQLKYRYAGHCDDSYDPEGIASLFIEDGRWVVDGEGGNHDRTRGDEGPLPGAVGQDHLGHCTT